jgi:hypothetical protein
MVKLMNESGKCVWIYGTTSVNYKNSAMRISGHKRMCPKLELIIKAMAMQALETAIMSGYTLLHSVEKEAGVNRKDVIINVELPSCLRDAVNKVIEVQSSYNFKF